jgi:hypothetical protein
VASFPFEDTYLAGESFADRAALRAKFAGGGPADDRGLVLGRWVPEVPLTLVRASGRKPLDCIGTTLAIVNLVSKRLVDLLAKEKFTGWSVFPVRLYGKDEESLPGYAGLAVRGRCGPIDASRSVPGKKVGPGGSVPIWNGMYFDPATWDGSDIFAPEGTTHIVVTGKVKRALDEHRITNIEFKRLTDVEFYEPHIESIRGIYADWRSRNN